jgi:glycosyltransferase involved in cell wall biosynthesis
MRLAIVSERLSPPYDEGIKNVAVNLVHALAQAGHQVLALTAGGQDDPEYGIRNVKSNRLLLSRGLASQIRRFQPEAVAYVPTACGTPFSFLRARILRFYGQVAPVAMVLLQPRAYSAWDRFLIRRLALDRVWVQSRRTAQVLDGLGCRTALLPPAVDVQRFAPVAPDEKAALRSQYGIPTAAVVVSHVGHLKEERNLSHIFTLQASGSYHTVVVGSTSTNQEAALSHVLREAGGTVIDTYVEHIEDIYHLSDVYLFPVEDETASIELPQSVLEAMACNLRVISTPFGGLPDAFAQGQGLFYWDGQRDLQGLAEAARSTPCVTRTLVENLTWRAAARCVVQTLEDHGAQW